MYQELYDAWRREKTARDLRPLPKNFYERVAEYIKKLKEGQRMLDNKTMKARLLKQEFENVKILSAEIVATRFRKMFESTMPDEKPVPVGFLAGEEESIYRRLSDASNQHSRLAKNILEGKKTEITASETEDLPQGILVRFTCDVPAIIGIDLRTYGPFKPEDIASLPAENAQALVHQGAAVKVEIEEK